MINAIIMAAGTSSRFAPISYEMPKALISVKGEILIERQIRQLREAGIKEVIVVTGYKAEAFSYLSDKFGVKLVHNPDYLIRNNNGSIYAVRDYLGDSFVCSSDNYFNQNPFSIDVTQSYYAAVYACGRTDEWCMTEDKFGYIDSVTVGGHDAWYMLGHTFWNSDFSRRFLSILDSIYNDESTKDLLWEAIFMNHLDELKMKIKKYDNDIIFEFDTLDELRQFDESYIDDTRSSILKEVSQLLTCKESEITDVIATKSLTNEADGFKFVYKDNRYKYKYNNGKVRKLD